MHKAFLFSIYRCQLRDAWWTQSTTGWGHLVVTEAGWDRFRTITCCTEKCAERAQRDAEAQHEMRCEVNQEGWVESTLWDIRVLFGEPEYMPWHWY